MAASVSKRPRKVVVTVDAASFLIPRALIQLCVPWMITATSSVAVDCGMAKSRQGWGLLNPEGMLRIK